MSKDYVLAKHTDFLWGFEICKFKNPPIRAKKVMALFSFAQNNPLAAKCHPSDFWFPMWSLARPCVLLSGCQLLGPGAARLRPFQSPEQWRQQSSSSSARPRTAFSSVPSEPSGGGVGCGHLVPAHHLQLLQPAEWGGGGGRGGQGGEGEEVEVDLVHLLSAGTESQVFRLWTQLLLANYLSE